MKRILAMLLLSAAAFTGCARPIHAYRVTEDSPAWDCRTMGNRICGVAR